MEDILVKKLDDVFGDDFDIAVHDHLIFFLEKDFMKSNPNETTVILNAVVRIIYNTEPFSIKLAKCAAMPPEEFWRRLLC